MKLKIVRYYPEMLSHLCEQEDGTRVTVDVQVDGALSDVDPNDIVGRTIECEYIFPYSYIASGVKGEHEPS